MNNLSDIIEKAVELTEKARREGLVSLDEDLAGLDPNIFDILKHGLRLSLDGIDCDFINTILSNMIAGEKDKKLLIEKLIQKEAVLGIRAGYNTRILALKLLSFLEKNERNALEMSLLDSGSDLVDLDLDSDYSKQKPVKPEPKIVLKQNDFIKQAAHIIKISYLFSCKARREGLLSLEDELEDIDYEFIKNGLRLVVDGTDSAIISDICSNNINMQQDENYIRFLLIQKEAILSIQSGENPNFLAHKLISYLNNSELKTVKEALTGVEFFKKNNFIDSNPLEKEGKKFSAQAANIIRRVYEFNEESAIKGISDLQGLIDSDKKAGRDIFEYGMNFIIDGIDSQEIDHILSKQIELEQNKDFKRLKLMQKAGVLGIFNCENSSLLIHTLLSYLNNDELEEIKKIFLNTDFGGRFSEILNAPFGSQEDINEMQKQYAQELENTIADREVTDFFNKPYDILENADQELLDVLLKQEQPQTSASLVAWLSSGCLTSGGIDAIVDILKFSDRSIEKQIIGKWEEKDKELAEEVKQRLFPFDDIVKLDDRAILKVMREVDTVELAKALKGADAKVQDKIFYNMSKRAASMLKEDMEYIGPVRVRDIEESRRKIISIIRYLEHKGEIDIP